MFVALGVLCTVGYTAYAITGSNTVPVTTAGDGTGAVNPYVASNIDYTLNLLTSYNIDAVTFTLAPAAAGSVKIVLNGSVYSCINTAGSVSCTTTAPQATVIPVTTMKVIAAS